MSKSSIVLTYSIAAQTRSVNLPFNFRRSLVESKKHKVRMDGQNEKTNKKDKKEKNAWQMHLV